jgi:O-antigen/teichoic acid export membrane protein
MKLARTGSHIVAWRAGQKLAGALTVVAVAQGLGPEGNGRYSLTLMVATVLAAVLSAGVGLASVPMLRRGRPRPGRILAAQAVWIALAMVAVAILAAVAWAGPLRGWLSGALTWDPGLLVAAVAVVLALLVFETANYDLLAAGEVVTGTRVGSLRALAHLAGVGVLLALARLDLTLAVWSLAAVHGAAAAFMLVRARRSWRHPAHAESGDDAPGGSIAGLAVTLARQGWLGQLSAIGYLLLLRLDQFILESYLGVAAVGVYALAAWGAELLWLLPEALNPLLVHTSSDHGDDDRDHTAARAVRLGLGATTLAAVPLALAAPPLLGMLRDGAYAGVAGPLWALLPGVVAFAPGAVLAGDFIGRGRPHWNTQASAITLVINVALCVAWIPRWGVVGAAWASSVAYAAGAAVMVLRFRLVSGLPWAEILVPRPSDLRR